MKRHIKILYASEIYFTYNPPSLDITCNQIILSFFFLLVRIILVNQLNNAFEKKVNTIDPNFEQFCSLSTIVN